MRPCDAQYKYREIRQHLGRTLDHLEALILHEANEDEAHWLRRAVMGCRESALHVLVAEKMWERRVMDHRHHPGEYQ